MKTAKLHSSYLRLWDRPEDISFEELLHNLLFSHNSTSEKYLCTSQNLARLARTEKGLLYLDPQTIAAIPGIGQARTSSLIAAIELARRQHTSEWHGPKQVDLHHLAHHLQVKLEGLDKEYFYLFSFNHSFGLIQEHVLARGGAQSVNLYFRDIIKVLLNDRASQTLIAHNHPDQSACPSPEDLQSMEKLASLLNSLGIPLIDQYIVGTDGVYSCKQSDFIRSPN